MQDNELMSQLDMGSLENSVWHYTNLDGLLSILETDELWASSPSAVNDASEMKFARQIFFEFWQGLKPKDFEAQNFISEVLSEEFFNDFLENVYFISGSKNSDLLNMWMHYSKSQGFAIELDVNVDLQHSSLDPLSIDPDEKIGLVYPDWYDVSYGQEPVTDNYMAAVRWLSELRTTHQFATESKRIEFGRVALLSKFLKTKHIGFKVEEEIRFVTAIQDKSLIRYRNKSGKLVPYIPLKSIEAVNEQKEFFKLPIKGIVCSPGISINIVKRVESMLKYYGYEEIPVKLSEIPYIY